MITCNAEKKEDKQGNNTMDSPSYLSYFYQRLFHHEAAVLLGLLSFFTFASV
jgi:hypothetical protein